MTTSVKVSGRPPLSVAQGTGIRSTRVPMVVVMVEQAVIVPEGWICPLLITIPGGLVDEVATEEEDLELLMADEETDEDCSGIRLK